MSLPLPPSARTRVSLCEAEVVAAYRHAVFNVLAHNRDDHLKQFAFLRVGGAWRRTPAYDLLYNEGPGGEHTLLVAGEGRRPGLEHLARLAELGGLRTAPAQKVVVQVREAVARFRDFAAEAGVSEATTDAVAQRLADRAPHVGGRTHTTGSSGR